MFYAVDAGRGFLDIKQEIGTKPRRLNESLFDAGTALFFLSVWLAPGTFGPADEIIRAAMLIVILEFILIHATAFLGSTAFSPDIPRQKKLNMIVGFALFFLLSMIVLSIAFQAWWPFLAFG